MYSQVYKKKGSEYLKAAYNNYKSFLLTTHFSLFIPLK